MARFEDEFDTFLRAIRRDTRKLLRDSFRRGGDQAKAIVETHLQNSENRFKRWTRLLKKGEIHPREFEILTNSQITLTRMRLRTVKAISRSASAEFRNRLRDIIRQRAMKIFLGD